MPHVRTLPPPPDAWLVVRECLHVKNTATHSRFTVFGVFDAPDSPAALACAAEYQDDEHRTIIVPDAPDLPFPRDGFWCDSPAGIRSRDIWFERHAASLEPYLVDPRTAQVFTYACGKLTDPLCTFRPIKGIGCPCPLPAGVPWPTCRFCNTDMVTVGGLDFREFRDVAVPSGSVVVHGCPACGFCGNEETWSVHWLRVGEPLTIHGDMNADVELGTRWLVTEYPTPLDDELRTGPLAGERAIYRNFNCPAPKVGGHAGWIQGDETLENDLFVFIGQLTGEDESLHLWDSPMVYLLYAPQTGKTIASLQSY